MLTAGPAVRTAGAVLVVGVAEIKGEADAVGKDEVIEVVVGSGMVVVVLEMAEVGVWAWV